MPAIGGEGVVTANGNGHRLNAHFPIDTTLRLAEAQGSTEQDVILLKTTWQRRYTVVIFSYKGEYIPDGYASPDDGCGEWTRSLQVNSHALRNGRQYSYRLPDAINSVARLLEGRIFKPLRRPAAFRPV